MSKIAYFVDVSKKEWRQGDGRSFLSNMISQHTLVVSVSSGRSPETAHFLKNHGILVEKFREAQKQGLLNLPEDQCDFLSDMLEHLPGGGLLEVLYQENSLKKPYIGDLTLWRPVTREKGDEVSTALTVANLKSYGFTVLDERNHKITPDSIAPREHIQEAVAKERAAAERRLAANSPRRSTPEERIADYARMRWNANEDARAAAAGDKGFFTTRRWFSMKLR